MLAETVRSFAAADLPIKIVGAPLKTVSDRAIFQFDIWRSRFAEYFRIWPGSRDTRFSVLDAHSGFRQVVLSVQEPRRPYFERVFQWGDRTLKSVEDQARRMGGEVVRDTGTHWLLRFWTSEQERRYLCGFDERTLFIAQIPSGSTVAEAHRALMPDVVARAPVPFLRQGEWFFLPPAGDEAAGLGDYARTHPRSHRREDGIEAGAQPHVADELVRMDRRWRRRGREERRLDVYVRGRVRHPDHCTVTFDSWQLTVRNRAVLPAGPDRERLRWID